MNFFKAGRLTAILLLCLLTLGLWAGNAYGSGSVEPMVSAGEFHSLALKEDGTVWAWGRNNHGQLGDGTNENRGIPVQVKGSGGEGFLTDVVAVSTGRNHSIALKADGTVWAWGRNNVSQLGDRTTDNSNTPVQVQWRVYLALPGSPGSYLYFPLIAEAISAGSSHNLALSANDTVWAWGYNAYGQLGDGTTDNRGFALQVKDHAGEDHLSDIVEISAGRFHSLALEGEHGNVWAWGSNTYGQLGDRTNESSNTPVRVKAPFEILGRIFYLPIARVEAISAGGYHSLALNEDGNAWAWGRNNHGQLGIDSTTDSNYAVKVKASTGDDLLSDLTAVSAGYLHSLAVNQAGNSLSWGSNQYGQLGNDSTDDRHRPGSVLRVYFPSIGAYLILQNVDAISSGWYHTLALREDLTTAWAWGRNNYGQLGDGTNEQRLLPVQVIFPDPPLPEPTWERITPTEAHALAYDGGVLAASYPSGTWFYEADDWERITPTMAHALAYDNGVLVGSFPSGTWFYEADDWERITPTVAHALAYDDGVVVASYPSGTWFYEAGDWERISTTMAHALAYDNGVVVGSFPSGTWFYY